MPVKYYILRYFLVKSEGLEKNIKSEELEKNIKSEGLDSILQTNLATSNILSLK